MKTHVGSVLGWATIVALCVLGAVVHGGGEQQADAVEQFVDTQHLRGGRGEDRERRPCLARADRMVGGDPSG